MDEFMDYEDHFTYKGNRIEVTDSSYIVYDENCEHEFDTEVDAMEYIDNRDKYTSTDDELDYFTPNVDEFEEATGLKLNPIGHNEYVVAIGSYNKVKNLVNQFNDDYNAFVTCREDNVRDCVIVRF